MRALWRKHVLISLSVARLVNPRKAKESLFVYTTQVGSYRWRGRRLGGGVSSGVELGGGGCGLECGGVDGGVEFGGGWRGGDGEVWWRLCGNGDGGGDAGGGDSGPGGDGLCGGGGTDVLLLLPREETR